MTIGSPPDVFSKSSDCKVATFTHFGRDPGNKRKAVAWKEMQLRGVHLRVLRGGVVELGDGVEVLSRGPAAAALSVRLR